MTIDAVLERLVLSTPRPHDLAEFYARAFGFAVSRRDANTCCEADGRSLWLRDGAANQLLSSHFRFAERAAFDRYARQLDSAGLAVTRGGSEAAPELSVTDPEGRQLCFRVAGSAKSETASALHARLQHYAVRTPDPKALVSFYVDRLGFTLSDLVKDGEGNLSAAFLRTDAEHHILAIFRAPQPRFDHFSCETADWAQLRDWADHMSQVGITLAWGVGRHGPGNDTFFMVKDPDGNLAEISSDLEICTPDRPVGFWPHRPETLNRWGVAIMRS